MAHQTKEEKLKYLKEVHEDCDVRWKFLQQGLPPGTGMNTIEMRLNTLIMKMIEWDIITEDQKIEFEIKFAEQIQDQLIEMKKEYDEQMKQAKAPKLVIANASQAAALRKV